MKKTITINIKGMDCTGCEASVKMLLETVTGVESAKVNFRESKAEIEYDNEKVKILEDLKEVLASTQYQIQ